MTAINNNTAATDVAARLWYSNNASGTFYMQLYYTQPGNWKGQSLSVYVNGAVSGLAAHQPKRAMGYGTSKGSDIVGSKRYELANHLGNVLSVITDRKWAVDDGQFNTTTGIKTSSTFDGLADYYVATIVSFSDYDPFGTMQDGRKGSQNGEKYRFGMNGMEKDDEIKGEGNSYTTHFRLLDPRLGRWFSIDPVVHPHFSPYNAFDNNPILILDPSGADGGTKKNKANRTHDVQAQMYFQFDDDLFAGMTPAEIVTWKAAYIANWKTGLDATWDGRSIGSNGYTLNTQTITYQEGVAPAGEKNANTITVTNGGGTLVNTGNTPSAVITNRIDNVSGFRNAQATFFAANGNRNVAHEFGHMMGLSERYFEGLNVTDGNGDYNGGKTVQTGRVTIPLRVGDEGNTSYLSNLMGTGGSQLTRRQEGVVLNRWRTERKYVKNIFILPDFNNNGNVGTFSSGVAWDGGRWNNNNLIPVNAAGVEDNTRAVLYSTSRGNSNAFYMDSDYISGSGRTRQRTGVTNTNTVIGQARAFGWIR